MTPRTTAALIAILVLVAYWIWVGWMAQPAPRAWHAPKWTDTEKAWVEKRMKYHGIESAVCDGEICWFVNAKKERCRL